MVKVILQLLYFTMSFYKQSSSATYLNYNPYKLSYISYSWTYVLLTLYKNSRNATHFHMYLYMGKISFQAFLCLDFSENKLFIVIKHVEKSIVLFSVSNKILYLYLVTVTHYVLYIRTVILSFI